jgi:DNA-binding NtrC family response regulator
MERGGLTVADGESRGNQPEDPGRKQVLLLVDDEEDIRTSLKTLFEVSLDNLNVLLAASGQEGLDVLKTNAVDIILTDYKMPGMNGLEFLDHARKEAPGVPRILITAFPDLNLAIRAINEARIENFITKPFEPERVVDVVKAVLKERRARELRDKSFARSMDLLRKKSNAD